MTLSKYFLAASALVLASLASAGPSQAQFASDSLSAILLGGNECNSVAPPAGPVCRRGDPDAFGRATITIVSSAVATICVTLQVDNLAGAAAAHIHRGRETVNGGIVVNLIAPNAPGAGNPGVSASCMNVAPALLAAMRANPAEFYVNVHNGAFPGGAIRGQLF